MPHIRIYIHLVFSTKERYPFLKTPELRAKVWKHIFENARSKGIYIDFINGYAEHCHILLSLGTEQLLSKTVQLIKGESAYWINQNKLCLQKFEWQNDYFAVSISDSNIEKVRNYIANQEEHHKIKTFAEEYDEFISRFELMAKG
ncbi:IS200/IS605 family transposase [Flavobacterium zepuense]|uniref:IS200/IS605 family transposase n=1 Tax=Flavobacterium zepuense TaxID=2593302 RepID=A0A552VA91_9FLAO|nr:IS200/IS605 family transposase [Flavobacterium zepuense]TRW27398.1 IS200/IS605 family transposase [Flavobacterium zepuense]